MHHKRKMSSFKMHQKVKKKEQFQDATKLKNEQFQNAPKSEKKNSFKMQQNSKMSSYKMQSHSKIFIFRMQQIQIIFIFVVLCVVCCVCFACCVVLLKIKFIRHYFQIELDMKENEIIVKKIYLIFRFQLIFKFGEVEEPTVRLNRLSPRICEGKGARHSSKIQFNSNSDMEFRKNKNIIKIYCTFDLFFLL